MKIQCKKVAVAILGYNSCDFLERFIPSVLATNYDDFTVVYIDNDSKDNSVQLVREKFPEVVVVEQHENYGFAGGYNVGLKNLEAEYFVLLNQDVEVDPNWLRPLVEEMESNEKIGAAQPKILHYADKSKFDYAGGCGGFLDKYGYPFCRGRIFDLMEQDSNQYQEPMDIFWASGACMIVRSKLYYELGGLDHDFFAHMEEIDLCWRMQGAGYKLRVVPSATVYHVGGSSLKYGSYRKLYLNYRNNLTMLLKNLPSNKVWQIMFIRMILDGISAAQGVLTFRFNVLRAVLMAHFDFYKSLKSTLAKRKQIKKVNDLSTVYNKSIVFQYYLLGRKTFDKINWKLK